MTTLAGLGFTPLQQTGSTYGSTSNYAAADAKREKLVAGRRIRVTHLSPALRGLHGVIVTPRDCERVGAGDCAVLLDEWDHPLAFYWNEIETLALDHAAGHAAPV
jgi:hypothetical protein